MASSTLVCLQFGSDVNPRAHSVISFRKAIPLHTFIMVWYSKGYNALKTAWITISIPWIYSFIYFAVLGASHQSGPDAIYRPAPVSRTLDRDFY